MEHQETIIFEKSWVWFMELICFWADYAGKIGVAHHVGFKEPGAVNTNQKVGPMRGTFGSNAISKFSGLNPLPLIKKGHIKLQLTNLIKNDVSRHILTYLPFLMELSGLFKVKQTTNMFLGCGLSGLFKVKQPTNMFLGCGLRRRRFDTF